MIVSKIKGAVYRVKDFLFQRFALPKAKREQISKAYIAKFLPPSPVVVDCGAYDGSDSIQLAAVLKAQVHAFEAVPAIFNVLANRTKSFSSIRCYPVALSNVTGRQSFFVSEGKSNASSSLLEPKDHLTDHPDTYFKQKIEVNTITLDEWAANNNIPRVDLLWLDMQGFEMQMLMASPKILSTVSAIHSEISVKETYIGVEQYSGYKKFLEQNGFEAVLEAIPPGWDMGNVLFVRKK